MGYGTFTALVILAHYFKGLQAILLQSGAEFVSW